MQSKFEPAELEQMHANIGKLISEAGKLQAETAKLNAETSKLTRERNLYPIVILAGAVGALGALAVNIFSALLKLL